MLTNIKHPIEETQDSVTIGKRTIKLERKDPYGMWHMFENGKEINTDVYGVYTGVIEAKAAATDYLQKH